MKKLVVAGLASTMIALSGCANNSTKEREEAVNSVTADALAKQNQQALPKKTPNVFIVDKAWIPVVKRFILKRPLGERVMNQLIYVKYSIILRILQAMCPLNTK